MSNLRMFCLTMRPEHENLIKKLNYSPVGLGDQKFTNSFFNDKTGLNISAADSDSNQAADAGSSSYVNPFRTTRYIGPIYSVHEHDLETGEYKPVEQKDKTEENKDV